MILDKKSKPMYMQIFEILSEKIKNREYKEGERLPSEKELADLYNVSRITSRKTLDMLAKEGHVIRQRGRGSFVTYEKEKLSYHSHEEDDEFLMTKNMLIGVVVTDFDYTYGTEIIYGLEEAARELGSFIVPRRTLGQIENEKQAIMDLVELGVEGLIIFPAQGENLNEEILKLVIEKFPIVLIDRHLKGLSTTSISTDNSRATALGVKYLFELGHRNIGLLTPPPELTTAIEERIDGFISAHAEEGIVVDKNLWLTSITSTLPNQLNEENIRRDINMIKSFLQENPSITALFAIEYHIAVLAKKAAEELGYKIPSDLSIICFDGPTLQLAESFSFTHLKQNEKQMGKRAVEMVMELSQGKKVNSITLLEANLKIGNSTSKVH
ncbi:GntR family transcriptional regulator [Neobacillus niacini]|uniref:GntR family transcriptional regulator n=1 Tax=Neobacillus niacini TaxID=86668 RepID=UPI0021AFDD30|nr:GntR family transcriptional regulator [Neobacillus niacini]